MKDKKQIGHFKVEGSVPVEFYPQKDGYVAYCKSLDLVTQGDTLEEAKVMFNEILEIFLLDLVENNNLKDLLDLGWTIEYADADSLVKLIIPPKIIVENIKLPEFA